MVALNWEWRKVYLTYIASNDLAPAVHVAFVHLRVDLATTLHEIERSDGPMRDTAGHKTAEGTGLDQAHISLLPSPSVAVTVGPLTA